MNRQDAKTPETPTLTLDRQIGWSDCDLDDIRDAASSGSVVDPQAAIVELVNEIDRRTPLDLTPLYGPACRERLSPPARTLLAMLVRSSSQGHAHAQIVGGQLQTAHALELRSMISTHQPFDPQATRKAKRPTFAHITERGKEVLTVWERGNVPESDYTPGLHPNYAER